MKECFICGKDLPLGCLFEEENGKPVCMECYHLFFEQEQETVEEGVTDGKEQHD